MPVNPCSLEERERLKKLRAEQARREGDVNWTGLPAVRKAFSSTVASIRSQKLVNDWVDLYLRTFDPGARGGAARQTEALTRGTNSRVSTTMQYGLLKAILLDDNMHEIFRKPHESGRREAKWRKFTDDEIVKYQTLREQGKSTGDTTIDRMFDYVRRGYDYDESMLRANKVPFGHIDNYFRHAFKNTETEVNAFMEKWQNGWRPPGFTKTRHFPTLADAKAAGLTPKSYNPERNLMAYHAQAITAIEQVQTMESLHESNLAIPAEAVRSAAKANDEEVDALANRNGFTRFSTPDKKVWYVRKGVEGVLHNAFDMTSIYNTLAMPAIVFARAFKGTTGVKLSFSVFHPIHIAGISASEVVTTAMQRSLQGTATGKDILDAIKASIPVVGGVFPMADAYRTYHNLLDVLRTGKGWEKLPDKLKTDLSDILAGGLMPFMGTERRSQMSDAIFKNGANMAKVRDALSVGYAIAKAEPYQEFMFGRVIPLAKISAFLARRDTLLQKHGEAYRGSLNWKVDMSNIGIETEGRFGEMAYDNLFWNKNWKMLGLALPLSMGWNLGFWRVQGGMLVDLTDNLAHADQIMKYWQTKGAEGRAPNLSNRLMYGVNYHLMSILSMGAISQLVGGSANEAMDWFFPKVGRKPNGEAERVRTPYWTSEWASIWEHTMEEHQKNATPGMAEVNALSRYFGNKMNPGLAAIFHVMNNKDFMGRDIIQWNDTRDPFFQRLWERTGQVAAYLGKDMLEPISFQGLFDERGTLNEPKQVVMGLMGFQQAPGWTTRTGLENEILTMKRDQSQFHPTLNEAAKMDAKSSYMKALQGDDQDLIAKTEEDYIAHGADQHMLKLARKHADEIGP